MLLTIIMLVVALGAYLAAMQSPPPTNVDVAGFIQAAGSASLLAKMIVDGIKLAVDLNRWQPVVLAFVFAMGGELLLLLAQGAVFTNQLYAQAAIIGLFAWGLSVGATALQTAANRTNEKIDKALAADKGTTRTQLEESMKKE